MPPIRGYLGIDNGTQGLSIVFAEESTLRVLATGEGAYGFVPRDDDDDDGTYEQIVEDWDDAIRTAMGQVKRQLRETFFNGRGQDRNDDVDDEDLYEILAIGISGQMHGEVLMDAKGRVLRPVRLWCDAGNGDEGLELTGAFGTKVPRRSTCARFLWTCRNRPDVARRVGHLTTPAGYMAWRLTGRHVLGIGDAAGMFPVHPRTLDYDRDRLILFDRMVDDGTIPPLGTLLPGIRRAGEDAGRVTAAGAEWLGIRTTAATRGGASAGIPVASAEGDQVAALAGGLIGRTGTVACSFGTSVCANIVGGGDAHAAPFRGVSPAVDHFCAADGKPIHMVWLRNGTTFLNAMVESYGRTGDHSRRREEGEGNENDRDGNGEVDAFAAVMPQLLSAPADCGGLLALPFMDDEPGLEVQRGRTAMILGLNRENARAGNVAKAALLSTMFNLKLGCGVLVEQGYPLEELVLSGGLAKTPGCGQILADVFDLPVRLPDSADEGCSWGAAVMAQYRYRRMHGHTHDDWPAYLESIGRSASSGRRFRPNPPDVETYRSVFARYRQLIKMQSQLEQVMI